MSRILILGGSGMLGHKMFQILGSRYPDTKCSLFENSTNHVLSRTGLFPSDKVLPGLDVMDFRRLEEVLGNERPDVLVNCVGVIKQRDAAHDPIPSITINSLLPHHLARMVGRWGGRVIHFSTDCVFSGSCGSYSEDSPSDAEDLYGKSKYLGEISGPNSLTLRTSIIGHELKNFASLLEWFIGQQGRTISGFRKVIYSGVTTNHLAGVVAEVIENHPGLSGLYQVAGNPISKFDLLCQVRDAYGLDIEILPEDQTVSDRSLLGGLFESATGLATPSWPELIGELAEDFSQYAAWRQG